MTNNHWSLLWLRAAQNARVFDEAQGSIVKMTFNIDLWF